MSTMRVTLLPNRRTYILSYASPDEEYTIRFDDWPGFSRYLEWGHLWTATRDQVRACEGGEAVVDALDRETIQGSLQAAARRRGA